jgi:hypothetical protein
VPRQNGRYVSAKPVLFFMDCPFDDCGYGARTRMSLHQHLVEDHADAVERRDATTYALEHPTKDDEIVVSAEAGVDDDTLERFSKEVAMLAFDKLLNRLEEE